MAQTGSEYTYEALRTVRGGNLHAVYAATSFDGFIAAITCPACDCTKEGDTETPNRRQEPCRDANCKCHDGYEAEWGWLRQVQA